MDRDAAFNALKTVETGRFTDIALSASDSFGLASATLAVALSRIAHPDVTSRRPSLEERIRSLHPGQDFAALTLLHDEEYPFFESAKTVVALTLHGGIQEAVRLAGIERRNEDG